MIYPQLQQPRIDIAYGHYLSVVLYEERGDTREMRVFISRVEHGCRIGYLKRDESSRIDLPPLLPLFPEDEEEPDFPLFPEEDEDQSSRREIECRVT